MTSPFHSPLAEDIKRYLDFKRAAGHPYCRGELTLQSLDRYVLAHAPAKEPLRIDELIYGWLSRIEHRKAATVATDLGVVRQFCLYRRRYDPDAFVPGRDWAPQSTESHFHPHIFSHSEIHLLLNRAARLRGPPIRATGMHMLILILYCAGLRVGEALRLRFTDVDLDNNVFRLRASKGKARIVPFRRDLQRELMAYLKERRKVTVCGPESLLFVRHNGTPQSVKNASFSIRRMFRLLGLKPQRERAGPRPYDLRHTFAVHRLTLWYRSGVDINARLPWLSAYMGHENILGTEVYLTATPELLAVAARRFERVALVRERGGD